jgi:hypothetical protein
MTIGREIPFFQELRYTLVGGINRPGGMCFHDTDLGCMINLRIYMKIERRYYKTITIVATTLNL